MAPFNTLKSEIIEIIFDILNVHYESITDRSYVDLCNYLNETYFSEQSISQDRMSIIARTCCLTVIAVPEDFYENFEQCNWYHFGDHEWSEQKIVPKIFSLLNSTYSKF